MKKLLVICGPTATGKTSLALSLARKFNGESVSADSRQVYKGMDIGTGKDLPKNSKFQISKSKMGFKNLNLGFYTLSGVRLWGYDLVEPTQDFSVAHYIKIAQKIIENIHKRGKLPILVGGAGLYIKGVVDGIDTADIKQNIKVRRSLEGQNTNDLYNLLVSLDNEKAKQLNESDNKNPRRLIRAIEISFSKIKSHKFKVNKYNSLHIGLKADKPLLEKRIDHRVVSRIERGMLDEVKSLIKSGVSWNSHSMMASGYKQTKDFLDNKITLKEAIDCWKRVEMQYAKRQLTWFRKDKRILWFDISRRNYLKGIEKSVQEWYSSE